MHRPRRLLAAASLCVALAAFLALVSPALAWQANWRMCAHTAPLGAPTGNPPVWSGPPVIDGLLYGAAMPATPPDLGWTRAWRYVFNNGTAIHDVAVQAVTDNTFFYMSFEVNHDTLLDSTDLIVIAIDPGGGGQLRLLNLFPLINGAVAPAVAISHWSSAALPFAGGGGAPPAGSVTATATAVVNPGNHSWFVEVKLDRAAFGIPAAGDFGLYFNVLVDNGPGGGPTGTVNEYAWPVPADISQWLAGDPKNVPATGNWGTATVTNVTCNGVSIASSDIVSTNTPPSKIIVNAQNRFNATVRNNTIDPGTGLPTVIAKQITAKFRWAAFGMPSEWNDIVADAGSTNPDGPTDIAANGQHTFTTLWTAPGMASFPGGHTCIMVELDTTAASPPGGEWTTTFAVRSNWNNFWLATASRFDAKPVIDTKGWGKPADGRRHRADVFITQRIVAINRELARRGLEITDNIKPGIDEPQPGISPWDAVAHRAHFPVDRETASFREYAKILRAPRANVSQLVSVTRACLRSGRFITIGKKKLEICDRGAVGGGYGFALRHAGLAGTAWTTTLQGKGLRPVDNARTKYRLEIPPGERLVVEQRIEARDVKGGGIQGGEGVQDKPPKRKPRR